MRYRVLSCTVALLPMLLPLSRSIVETRQLSTSVKDSISSKGHPSELWAHNPSEIIPKGYDRTKAPTNPDGSPLEVDITLSILNIRSVDVDKSSVTMDIFFYQGWRDRGLNYPSHLKTERIVLDSSWSDKIWTPDSYFKNSFTGYIHKILAPESYILMYRTKKLFYAARVALTMNCPMRLESFPHDVQECPVRIALLQNTIHSVVLKWDEFKISPTVSLAQFDVSLLNKESCTRRYKRLGTFSCICAGLRLTRRLGYYVMNMYIPSSLIVMMSFVTFWLPAEAYPARVALPVTSLLSLVTQLRQGGMPNVSYVMAISIWMSSSIAFVFLSLLEYALVIAVMDRRKSKTAEIEALRKEAQELTGGEMKDYISAYFPGEDDIHMSHVDVDRFSRVTFPMAYFIFSLVYWLVYGV